MSRAFDAYYRKAIQHDWDASRMVRRHLVEADETIIRNYNDIWQPAVDFVQDKLSNLSNEDSDNSDKWFLEALQGALSDNQIRAEDAEATDNKTIRQKIDGLTAKIDSMLKDAPSGEVATYMETFSAGMKSFKNRIDVATEPPPAPEGGEAGAPPPEGGAPPPAEGGEKGGAAAPKQAAQPPPDQQSASALLKDLKLA